MAKNGILANLPNRYVVYSILDYTTANKFFIDNNYIAYKSLTKLAKDLESNNYYHFRITKNNNYIFFGDIDDFPGCISEFINLLSKFLQKYYNLDFTENEFKYTQNNCNINSYHYSIPKWNLSTEKLKEIHSNFKKYNIDMLTKNIDGKSKHIIDTSIYSNHWFRYPNQYKGNIKNMHIVKHGNIKDFIIDNIPKNSLNIDNQLFVNIDRLETIKKKENNIIKLNIINKKENDVIKTEQLTKYNTNELALSSTISQPELYKKVFDECYKQNRFEEYDYWCNVGFAIKNTFLDEDIALKLFDYYSSKGSNYDGYSTTEYKYKTFVKKNKGDGVTIGTIYFYAIEDNKPKFIEIMNKNTFELGQTDMCHYLKLIAGYKFLYKKIGEKYKLYSYNGKYWQNDDILIKKCISTELYDFLKMILIEVYWNNKDFGTLKTKIEKLKNRTYKNDIVETYKEYGVNDEISFDDKWWLLGFNNLVYDLKLGEFREHKYDDYIATTTGYNWREPTQTEIATIQNLLDKIMPIEEERNLYLQILSTALDGQCLEKFTIFNGGGGNGKGMINDLLLLALGNHAIIGNNGILFETSKTGSNPEKANLHKKRLVIFREPPEKNKFENAIIKELTGGGTFSARTHLEKETIKELNLTMIIECNKKPVLAEEPTEADVRRIIDLYFRSTFTSDVEQLDNENYIFEANPVYKTKEFQNKHKYALLKILFDEYKKYYNNNFVLPKCSTIMERTNTYLELSCNIVQWFKDNYKYNKNEDLLKIKDIFINFNESSFFQNLTKFEKRKYNKTFFVDYVKTNIFFKKYYKDRYKNQRNVIIGWNTKI